MNFNKTIMAASILAVASTVANEATGAEIISRPDFKVVDGKMTPELMEAFGRVTDPQVSPDKKKILYNVEFISLKADKGNKELWTMNIDGSNPQKITNTAESEVGAVWIKNGTKIAFLSSTDDGMQLFTMDPNGENRKQISNVEKGIDGFLFSPDETKILLIRNIKYGKASTDVYPDLDKADVKIVDDLMYKHWDHWVTEIPHPFIGNVSENGISDIVDIMEGEPYECPMLPFGGTESFSWSPDSKTIAFTDR